ncbi:DUF5959 family protein [Streptomyces sp. Ru72]|uniref:DUF5959 family protein n=1 Tax=Streptomyces sp. Ru72 TaxID=2080747 RepID=UPI000CDE4D33|nr:DUF5959 family protein [Streptomyces sp. Ru72]POX50234.1 hypothetical protein C3488_15095 [Streptomyces sp. Ru72]
MADAPIDLMRLEGEGNSVVLRITGMEPRRDPDAMPVLTGEFLVDTPFVRGSVPAWLLPEDLRQWQQVLDALDAGRHIAWRAGTRGPRLFVERDEDGERCRVTVEDASTSSTATATVPLKDEWFDDAYHRLDLIWETWPLNG